MKAIQYPTEEHASPNVYDFAVMLIVLWLVGIIAKFTAPLPVSWWIVLLWPFGAEVVVMLLLVAVEMLKPRKARG